MSTEIMYETRQIAAFDKMLSAVEKTDNVITPGTIDRILIICYSPGITWNKPCTEEVKSLTLKYFTGTLCGVL